MVPTEDSDPLNMVYICYKINRSDVQNGLVMVSRALNEGAKQYSYNVLETDTVTTRTRRLLQAMLDRKPR